MLALNSVSKWYGTVCALDRLSVTIPDDCYVSLLGASGSGKTTLLRVIAGFEEQDEGTIAFDEARLDGTPPHRRGIGFVFQNFALFPHLSVFDNVAFGLRYRQQDAERDEAVVRQRVADVVRLVGLEGLERRAVTAISGGQRQRVALARTLVTEPRVVLLDEPLGALDANLRERMCDELKAIRERLGVTFLHVTGSESEALLMGDMVAVLAERRIAQIAPAEQLYARPVSPDVARRLNAYNILSGRFSGEQISRPHELYTRPRTAFVARFIGSNATLAGSDLAFDGEDATVQTAFGRMSGRCSTPMAAGSRAMVVIPAEAMRISAASQDVSTGWNRLRGQVRMRHAVGSVGHFKIDLGDGHLVDVETSTDNQRLMALSVGDTVSVECPSERVTIVPAA